MNNIYLLYISVGLTNISATYHLSITTEGEYAICLYFYSQAFKTFFFSAYKNTMCLEKGQQGPKPE